jgi:hypothetical protein
LLAEQDGEGAFGEAAAADDVLHGLEIDQGAWAGVAEGAASEDIAPLGGKITDFLENLGESWGAWHRSSCLVLARGNGYTFLVPLGRTVLRRTKLFLASTL